MFAHVGTRLKYLISKFDLWNLNTEYEALQQYDNVNAAAFAN